MSEALICDGVRTPIGRYGGALSSVRQDDLAAFLIAALMARSPNVTWFEVDDVILGFADGVDGSGINRRRNAP